MPDLLLEVLSEEIPARMQKDGALALANNILSRLQGALLTGSSKEAEYFYTPRRLVVRVGDLPTKQPNITVERKGPRVDAPEKAIQGFLKSTGLTLDDCEQRETPKGPVWFAITQEKGRPTGELLADLLPEALAAVRWPKSMRWEDTGVRWVRPIRSILCLLDSEVVPFCFGSVESGRTTYGHQFLFPTPRTIEHASSFEATLKSAKVILDQDERRVRIVEDAKSSAKREGLSLVEDEWLEKENAGLVEWPVVRMGSIDEHFMDLPQEVLRSAMRKHQRYFGVIGDDGQPAPRFVMVANTEVAAASAEITGGNERVLRARLSDARFFWDQDRRQRLENRLNALEGVIFHARLGSMKDKAERIASLAHTLCIEFKSTNEDWAADADPEQAYRAGLLCKADLVTEMVGEFPDLQGIMGRYYAQADHEPVDVSEAIAQHYVPQGPYEVYPTPPVSLAVALADKLDTLAGFFAIDERPTGSKDPFALRRAALGVIRLIIGNGLRLPLGKWLIKVLDRYNTLLPLEPGPDITKEALLTFFVDRLKVYIRDHGFRHDLLDAVFGVRSEDDLVRLFKRVEALDRFLRTDDGASLLTAYRRAANILRIEEKKDGERYEGEPDSAFFATPEERTLHESIPGIRNRVNMAAYMGFEKEHFEYAMAAIVSLREPVDAFFDNVTVNCEDPALRRNRLLMLSQIRSTLDRVADFSKIEG